MEKLQVKQNKMFFLMILFFTVGLFSILQVNSMTVKNVYAATFHKDQKLAIGCDIVGPFVAEKLLKMDIGKTWEIVCGDVKKYKCDECTKYNFKYYEDKHRLALGCDTDKFLTIAKPIYIEKDESELVKCER
jgi:hypothetical protein